MLKLNDGVVQIIVRDGKIMVVALNLGGGERSYIDVDDDDFSFQVDTLMAGMEYVLRMHGATPQALDFAAEDAGASLYDEIRRVADAPIEIQPDPWPEPPAGFQKVGR